jgi:hypothetical protein
VRTVHQTKIVIEGVNARGRVEQVLSKALNPDQPFGKDRAQVVIQI